MFEDEKIAVLRSYRRKTVKEGGITIEEARNGLKQGFLTFKNGVSLSFETHTFSEKKIPVIIFKNFYQEINETKESAVFVHNDLSISQVIHMLSEDNKTINMEQWEKLLVNGMEAKGLFTKVIKREQLEYVEYICYEVPSKTGWVYNIMFRIKGMNHRFICNFNCLKQEATSYGVVFEAMVYELNQWFME